MYLMEVALGQFSQLGPLEVWKSMSPIGRGVGFAMCTMSLIVAIYYNVVMGWCLHYMFASFTSKLPWEDCGQDFNSDLCFSITDFKNCVDARNKTGEFSVYHKGWYYLFHQIQFGLLIKIVFLCLTDYSYFILCNTQFVVLFRKMHNKHN